MSKITHYSSVMVRTDRFTASVKNKPNTLVEISVFPREDVIIAKFFIPTTSTKDWLIMMEIIKARAKRDFKITFGHYAGGSL